VVGGAPVKENRRKLEEVGRAIPLWYMSDHSEGEGEVSEQRNRLCTIVQSKKVAAKLTGVLEPKSHQRNPTCCRNGPCLVSLLHSVIDWDKLLCGVASALWTECRIWSQQSITLPILANVRGYFLDSHNAFSYYAFMRLTILIKVWASTV